MKSIVEFGAISDKGRIRPNNEDSLVAAPELGLFVVSDGMGGAASGEVASQLTVEAVAAHCREAAEHPTVPFYGRWTPGVSAAANRLASAVRLANRVVLDATRGDAVHRGMGATVVAVLLDGQRLAIAHVGDSRAYRLRDKSLQQLTRDHSLVGEQVRHGLLSAQEAGESRMQSVLLRAVGLEQGVEVEIGEELLLDGDILLLCSDGLTRELSDSEIAGVLGRGRHPQESARELADLANTAGGGDNITALVINNNPSAAETFLGFGRLGRWLQRN